jgi:RHS repeat-associated protein
MAMVWLIVNPASRSMEIRLPCSSTGTVPFTVDENGNAHLTAANLSHRYLWGPAVDQLLADEQVTDVATPGNVVWPLANHLGTVNDLATTDGQSGVTSVANHRVFDSFGKLESVTNAAIECLVGFTGLPFDKGSGMNVTATRPYDPAAGRWDGKDWIGFDGRQTNLSQYVGNGATYATDPTGEEVLGGNSPWNPLYWFDRLCNLFCDTDGYERRLVESNKKRAEANKKNPPPEPEPIPGERHEPSKTGETVEAVGDVITGNIKGTTQALFTDKTTAYGRATLGAKPFRRAPK